jgi:predicted DNA-binding protein YlxM (UPF0122 family)
MNLEGKEAISFLIGLDLYYQDKLSAQELAKMFWVKRPELYQECVKILFN